MGLDKKSKDDKRSRSRSKDKKSKKDKDKHKKRSKSREREPTRPKRQSKFDLGIQDVVIDELVNQAQSLLQSIQTQPKSQPAPLKNEQFSAFDQFIQISSEQTGNKKDLPEFTIINPNLTGNPGEGFGGGDEYSSLHQSILAKANININPQGLNDGISFIPPTGMNPLFNPYGLHPALSILNDPTKLKRKIQVPDQTFNYTGLIIGPKGANQKRLEEETGCKILVRGKGSQKEGMPPQPDDNDPQYVLIVGETESQLSKAQAEIERILFADEDTRNRIRQEQLRVVAQLKNDPHGLGITNQNAGLGADLSLTTPYGPPSHDAFIIPVPNDCVGLVIGKGGETIKQLKVQTGAKNVQVAVESAQGANTRNVFVEGDKQAYEKVKRMLQDIVENQQKLKANTQQNQGQGQKGGQQGYTQPGGMQKEEYPVPDNMVGLVIGKGGETIKTILHKTGTHILIPKQCEPGLADRILTISGRASQVQAAKDEIKLILQNAQQAQQQQQQQKPKQQPQMQMGGQSYGPMGGVQGQIPPPPIGQPPLTQPSTIQLQNEAALLQQQQGLIQQPGMYQQPMYIDPAQQYFADPSQFYYYQQLLAQQQQPQITETIIDDSNENQF